MKFAVKTIMLFSTLIKAFFSRQFMGLRFVEKVAVFLNGWILITANEPSLLFITIHAISI